MKNILMVLILLFSSTILFAQEVSGTITDNSGVTLPGVNVLEKGTNNGSITDFDGKYKIAFFICISI